MIVFVCDVVL